MKSMFILLTVVITGVTTAAFAQERDKTENAKKEYKPNLLSFAPIQFTENGLGLGLTYERGLDKDGIIAFYIPVLVTFNLNNSTYQNASGQRVNGHQDMMMYAMPGVKIYPTGAYGAVRYAVGPSLVIASGQKSSTAYDPISSYSATEKTEDHFMLGMIINNSLNINPTSNVYLGLELGMGFTYLNRVAGLNQDTNFLVQGGFKIGFRF
jgi:hypothetical protein